MSGSAIKVSWELLIWFLQNVISMFYQVHCLEVNLLSSCSLTLLSSFPFISSHSLPTCFRGWLLASSRKPIPHGLSLPRHLSLGLVFSRWLWARPLGGGNIITPFLCPSRPGEMLAVANLGHASPFPVGLQALAISSCRANSFYGTSWHYLYFPH